MRGFNHIAGGLAFTGIFASFAEVNVFSKPEYVVSCVFFSLLADIDHTQSTIGKLFYPLAKWIDRKYGHRTVTHSLPFYLAVVGAVGVAELLITGDRTVTGIAALAYGSHLLFDMCTRAGIPLFMPITRARCVLPGNPDLRMSSKNPFTEVAVFFGFVLLNLSALPLMANGFWVTVNNEFATYSHVQREMNRKTDVLFLETKEGHNGQVVSVTPEGATIFNGRRFVQLTEEHHPATFRHTGKTRQVQRLEFVSISPDSLRKLLTQPVISLTATGSAAVKYRVAGQQFEQASMKLDYPDGFEFSEVLRDNSATLAQIARLRATVAAHGAEVSKFNQEQRVKSARIVTLNSTWQRASAYEQGKSTDEVAKLKAELASAQPPAGTVESSTAVAEITRLKASLTPQKHTFTGVATIWKL